ncbi:DUF983 domain-containing protein [Spirosoma aureum]|uniref:DUF983 domain-containing protein n=1 Tax=Spirosoma aureum TaxID=2692134 RepID=A0A6G9AMW9_9BACT|nr:DUF983 domain-containing protein [Spirosoma aureum]QIP13689.1 DUF983 domain-containing protein [Spirosoma aureum]
MIDKLGFPSILANRWPHCHQERFFVVVSAFNLPKFDQMHAPCAVCGLNFESETGFYTGSLYVSYALFVAWTLTNFGLFALFLGIDVLSFLWPLIGSNAVLTPYFFRLACRIWFRIFMST